MKHEVPKPSKGTMVKINRSADKKLRTIARLAGKRSGGQHFPRAYIIHRLITDADPALFADRLASEAKK